MTFDEWLDQSEFTVFSKHLTEVTRIYNKGIVAIIKTAWHAGYDEGDQMGYTNGYNAGMTVGKQRDTLL